MFLFCSSLFRTEGRWFWVGFNKRDPEHPGAWEWSDGSPVSTQRCSKTNHTLISRGCMPYGFVLCVSLQVETSFIEDKNDEDDRRDCAVYSDLTNALMPQPCEAKHEWICKMSRGKNCHTCIIYHYPGNQNSTHHCHLYQKVGWPCLKPEQQCFY